LKIAQPPTPALFVCKQKVTLFWRHVNKTVLRIEEMIIETLSCIILEFPYFNRQSIWPPCNVFKIDFAQLKKERKSFRK